MLVTTLHGWWKIHIFHLGIKHWVDLYNTTFEGEGWIVVDIVDTDKKKSIRDNISVSGKVTLTGALKAADKDNADPEIIYLADTADEIDLELSKVKLSPRRRLSTKLWTTGFRTGQSEKTQPTGTIQGKLNKGRHRSYKTDELNKSYKEIIK